MNDPREDWKKQCAEWTKYLKDEKCFRSTELAKQNLLPVSAYLYTLLNAYRDNLISKELDRDRYKTFKSIMFKLDATDEDEIKERFDEIKDFTNIKLLSSKLSEEVIAKRKVILMNDIAERYDFCRRTITDVMSSAQQEQEILIESGQKSLEEIRVKRDEFEKRLQEAQQDKKELSEYVEHLRATTKERIDQLMDSLKSVRG